MSRFSRTVSSVSSVSSCGTTPRRERICGTVLVGVDAEHREVAAGARRDGADHAHRRGLARAVGAQETKRLARRNVEIDGVDGREQPALGRLQLEALGQAAGMDKRGLRSRAGIGEW